MQTLWASDYAGLPMRLSRRAYRATVQQRGEDIEHRFGNSAEEPLPEEVCGKVIHLLEIGAELVNEEMIKGITVQITGSIKADIKPDKYGAAKVTRENKVKF
jgi:predicted RNase H-related nuclease YkuK (DUF458 family)